MEDSLELVPIDIMRDIIVIEKTEGDTILKGSKAYCGCCGKILGTMSEDLPFPFRSDKFSKLLTDKTFDFGMGGGLHHKTCKHTMFAYQPGWSFIKLEDFLTNITKGSA